MADDQYESVLCVKSEVLVYKIPPRPSARGYKAQDWNLDNPDWTGRLKVISIGHRAFLKLEDKESGKLYAQCPIEAFPSAAIEPVLDSSRFFVVRITDETGSRNAFVGMGFRDRADSFDMNVALQDHFKWVRKDEEAKAAATATASNPTGSVPSGPKLDLGFREGESITVKLGAMKVKEKSGSGGLSSAGGILLPPPPPPGSRVQHVRPATGVSSPAGVSNSGSSGSLSSSQGFSETSTPSIQQQSQQPSLSSMKRDVSDDLLGLEFGGNSSSSSAPQQAPKNPVTTAQASSNQQSWIEF